MLVIGDQSMQYSLPGGLETEASILAARASRDVEDDYLRANGHDVNSAWPNITEVVPIEPNFESLTGLDREVHLPVRWRPGHEG